MSKRQQPAAAGSAVRDRSRDTSFSNAGPKPPKILFFNFFDGILLRGIPLYVRNLRIALEKQGVVCGEVVCPVALRRLPRGCLNVLFVVYEQLLMPFYGATFDRVIYPYNSASIVDALRGKSLLILHDFILSSRRNKRLVARYARFTQRILGWLGSDVAYISRSTERIGRTAGMFDKSRTFLFPNSYYTFLEALPAIRTPRQNHVLLCSGWGGNKDLAGALALYRDSGLWRSRGLRILGIAGHSHAVEAFRAVSPEVAANITVLPRLEDTQVGAEYHAAAWVWVHSMKEGYGRSIAEATLCGCRVVASDIPPFREQRGEAVFLYSGCARFITAVENCEAAASGPRTGEPAEHAWLSREIDRYLQENDMSSR